MNKIKNVFCVSTFSQNAVILNSHFKQSVFFVFLFFAESRPPRERESHEPKTIPKKSSYLSRLSWFEKFLSLAELSYLS